MTNFDQVLTYPDLAQWLADNLTGSSAHLLDGEVIIHTGLTVEMNGELLPIEDIEEEPNPKWTGFYWQGNY